MVQQGREYLHPMMQYPQAVKLAGVPFLSKSVRTTFKSHWQIRGVKGIWRYRTSTSPDSDLVESDEMIAWFYPSWQGKSIQVNYGRFYRDMELEQAVKGILK